MLDSTMDYIKINNKTFQDQKWLSKESKVNGCYVKH